MRATQICVLILVCACGFASPLVVRAQQAVTVTPEVKADALRRLDLSRSAQIPQSMVNKDGLWLRICNKGPKPSDPGNQEEACSRFVGESVRPRSLDDLLPAFKYCAISNDCSMSIKEIAESGHPDYALALAEFAPSCRGCVTVGAVFRNDSTGNLRATVFLNAPHSGGWEDGSSRLKDLTVDSNNIISVGTTPDVLRLLQRSCLEAGSSGGCHVYQNAGGNYDESTRSQAALARQNEDAASTQARKDQDSSYYRAEASSQQRTDAVLGALNSSNATIQQTAVQQQADLQTTAAAVQQRQQAQEQARLAAEQNSRAAQATATNGRPIPTNTTANSSSTAVASAPTLNPSANPYNPTPAQGSYNPYTGAGSGSIQGSCTDMTGSVQGSVKVGSDGWVSGYLTNNSNQTLFVSYTFKQNGVPSTAMANSAGTTIQGGQTVGGEGQGLYSTGADKNPPEIYWYAVLKSDHDKYGCAHKW